MIIYISIKNTYKFNMHDCAHTMILFKTIPILKIMH